MTTRIPFQYVLLQYVHDVVTGEFLNVGIALYSKEGHYFKSKLLGQYRRITSAFPEADGEFYRQYINYLQSRLDDLITEPGVIQPSFLNEQPDQISLLLTRVLPKDDASIRFSEPRFGSTDDLDGTFDHLYSRLVERHLTPLEKSSRDDEEIWRVFRAPLVRVNAVHNLQRHIIETKFETFEFQHAWKNGHWNVLHPLSFDMAYRGSIQRKAKEWLGATQLLSTSQDLGRVYLLLGKPSRPDVDLTRAYSNAKKMFQEQSASLNCQIVEEEQAEEFAENIAPLINEHSNGQAT